MNEKIVETQAEFSGKDKSEQPGVKNCKQCNSSFDITDKDIEFYDKVSPKFGGIKYNIPIPTLCPDCRFRRRLSFRNLRKLYKNKSIFSDKNLISIINPLSDIKVISLDEWWDDSHDLMKYGREFDYNKSFYEQFKELSRDIPRYPLSLDYLTIENSDYINGANTTKDSYLSFSLDNCEKVFYSELVSHGKDVFDCLNVSNVEDSYECIDSEKLNKCFFSKNLINSFDCYFCIDSDGCSNCFACANLKNKAYYIFNKEYTQEEYIIKKQEILSNIDIYIKEINDFLTNQIKKENFNVNIENSSGDYLLNLSNSENCYFCTNGENLKHCFQIKNGSNYNYDLSSWGQNVFNSYESTSIGNNASNCLFSYSLFADVSNLIYCIFCGNGSSNLFGCFGLSGKKYCIFNKQYTKEEYEDTVPKIIKHMQKTGEWGEYLNPKMSDFGYNETTAYEFYPLKKSEAIKYGFNWSDYEASFPKVEKIIKADKLPKRISEIPDDILNWAIECEVTKKPFRILKEELEFYRKHSLPIPKLHPDERHLERLKQRNPRKLFDRECDKCDKKIKTTFSQEREEIVYCEDCYNKEIY